MVVLTIIVFYVAMTCMLTDCCQLLGKGNVAYIFSPEDESISTIRNVTYEYHVLEHSNL